MAVIDFPSSPTIGQIHTQNDISWIWTGITWDIYSQYPTTPIHLIYNTESDLLNDQANQYENFIYYVISTNLYYEKLSTSTGSLSDYRIIISKTYLENNYVPYTGATKNVNLGEFGLRTGNIIFDTTPTNIPTVQGAMYWDVDDETVALIMNGAIQKIGEDSFYPVKNQTGTLIPKGTNVRFAGTVGNSGRLLIAPFIANGTFPSSYYMGVTMEAIANGEDGKVMWFGRIRGINTNAYNEGDILYASTTIAGGFQTTVPVAPNNIVQVAAVITKAINQGTIFVRPQIGSNINNDEGVKITNPVTGQLLQLQSNGLWENRSLSDIGVVTGSGANGQVTFWTGTSTISGSNNLFWDNTNTKLQISGTGVGGDDYILSTSYSNPGGAVAAIQNTNSTGWSIIRFLNNSGTRMGSVGGGNSGASVLSNSMYITAQNGFPLVLGTSTTAVPVGRLTVTSDGKVLIGTQTSNTALLRVNGDGWFDGNVISPNFRDTLLDRNVNLANNGVEGRGVVAGFTGSAYSGLGYNVRHTTGVDYIAPGTDTSSYLRFTGGGFEFLGAGSGVGGRTLSYSTLASLSLAGNLSLLGNINWGQSDRGITWGMNTDGAYIKFFNTGDGDTDSRLEYATFDNSDEYHRFMIASNERFTIKNDAIRFNNNIVWHAGNDGSGSGLDADTLDGYHETGFAVNQRGGNISDNTGINDNTRRNGMYRVDNAVTSSPDSGRYWALNVYGNQSNVVAQLASDFQTGESYVRGYNSSWSSWRRLLDTSNYSSYALPIGGSWYGVNLPGSRWGGYAVSGGEIVFGNGLPNAGQMGILVDGCYVAGENNGFWSLPSNNDWNGRRGMFWNGTYLDFTTNSATAYFTNALINGNQVWHAGNDGSGSGLDADTVDGFHAAQTYTSGANESGSYLGGHYSSGGNEKPNSNTFNAGKLKLAMLSNTNLGFGGFWNDVLWLSSYTGGDVKSSHALVFDKYSSDVWVSDQNYDSSSWGTGYKLWHSGNDGSGSGLDADTLDGLHASAFALVNGSTSNSFNVFETTYPQTQFNPSLAPRTGLNPMSMKMWDNYFAGSGLGSDYGTVLEYYSRIGHVDTQVYFDASGGSWYRTASYNAGWQVWQRYITDFNYTSYSPTLAGGGAYGTWGINITGNSAYATSSGNADTVDGFHASQITIANGIVVRDGSGYIFGNYINMTDDGNPGSGSSISSFITKQGDNYYRSVSPTNAMASIRSVASGTWGINISGSSASATSAGNSDTVDGLHASAFVRTYQTVNNNIDSDYGECFITFDPIPSGTPPIASPNIRTINVGNNFDRRTQLAFDYAADRAWFRRKQDSTWNSWREFVHSGNIGSQSVSYATSAGSVDWANITGQRTLTRDDAGLQGNAGARSGFFETVSPTNYYPGANSWQHLIEARHTNDGNNYAMQIAGSFFDQDFWVRKTVNSPTTSWSKLWHSGNFSGTLQAVTNLGNTTTTSITAANFITSSDRRLKTDIQKIENALEKLSKFASYEYIKDGKQDAGFIAQEVKEVLPYSVFESGDDKMLTMSDRPILAYIHKAILELKEEIDKLKNKN